MPWVAVKIMEKYYHVRNILLVREEDKGQAFVI